MTDKEFNYQLQKHLEKEIPELVLPPKPTIDEIVCAFLETFDVFVKPSTLAKRDPLGDAVTGGVLDLQQEINEQHPLPLLLFSLCVIHFSFVINSFAYSLIILLGIVGPFSNNPSNSSFFIVRKSLPWNLRSLLDRAN